MPIAFAQNSKDLQSSDHVFHFHSFASQFAVYLLFCLGQFVEFAVFQWQNHSLRFALQTPITQISPQFQSFSKMNSTQLKQFVIVRPSFAEKGGGDFFALFINQKLSFQRVSLFLSRIKSALFFFGRSIKLSVTSTMVYLIESSLSSLFFPGKENFPDLIKISSIRHTRRETFDSCKFQSLPKWNKVRYSRQKESVKSRCLSISDSDCELLNF